MLPIAGRRWALEMPVRAASRQAFGMRCPTSQPLSPVLARAPSSRRLSLTRVAPCSREPEPPLRRLSAADIARGRSGRQHVSHPSAG